VEHATPLLSTVVKIVIVFLLIGVLGVSLFLGWDYYTPMMLSPLLAPFIVPAVARWQEKFADRVTADLGYGVLLAEVFTSREFKRAQQ